MMKIEPDRIKAMVIYPKIFEEKSLYFRMVELLCYEVANSTGKCTSDVFVETKKQAEEEINKKNEAMIALLF